MDKEHNPVGWFEIPVNDLARAKAFYEAVFEVELEEHDVGPSRMAWFPMYEAAIGAAGSLVKADGYKPSPEGVVVYFTAPDLEATIARARKNGGTVIRERTSIGEYGFIAMIRDTEGNRIGLHCRK
jgi:predicted enzyme related to lactoylglutathione lyase